MKMAIKIKKHGDNGQYQLPQPQNTEVQRTPSLKPLVLLASKYHLMTSHVPQCLANAYPLITSPFSWMKMKSIPHLV
jgi:hypothetical protein